ncbi:hypothetical protein ACW9UR_20635 [Halovulum sp. GXIMD14794]
MEIVQTNFSENILFGDGASDKAVSQKAWYSLMWYPFQTNEFGDQGRAQAKLEEVFSEITGDYSRVDFSSDFYLGSSVEGRSFVVSEARRIDVDDITGWLLRSFDNDYDNFSDVNGSSRSRRSSIDLREVNVVKHSSPPEWISLFDLLSSMGMLSAEIRTAGDAAKLFLWVVGLSASGVIVMGAARGIAAGLQMGLQERIFELIKVKREDDGDGPS